MFRTGAQRSGTGQYVQDRNTVDRNRTVCTGEEHSGQEQDIMFRTGAQGSVTGKYIQDRNTVVRNRTVCSGQEHSGQGQDVSDEENYMERGDQDWKRRNRNA